MNSPEARGQPPHVLWFPLQTADGRQLTLTPHRWDRETGEVFEIGKRRFRNRRDRKAYQRSMAAGR